MASLPETPEEHDARLRSQLTEQRLMLEHLPKWIKVRGLRQKDVALALGVSEATVSQWIKGGQQMSVGQLRQIAALLKAEPGDLLAAPDEKSLTVQVEETLAVMDRLSASEWQQVLTTARMIADAKGRG